jgi:HAE1 family hydrophobic/amphiphilic exporter-1
MLLAALVVWFFLRDWRATMITAFAMPVSLIPTFFVIKMFGFSLNTVTLLGLTLVIGILIDDAIVEIENIEKRVKRGMRPYEAAMQGADAIGLAVVATTAAIVVVFAPVSFMTGMVGQFFREFGLTVCVAVLFSLLVARLADAADGGLPLSANLVHTTERPAVPGLLPQRLDWALDHRIVALARRRGDVLRLDLHHPAAAVRLPAAAGFRLPVRPGPGSAWRHGARHGGRGPARHDGGEKRSRRHGRVRRSGLVGPANPFTGGGGSDLRSANLNVLLKTKDRRSGDEIRADLRPKLREVPDARISFAEFGPGGGTGYQQILTSARTPAKLQAAASELGRRCAPLDTLADPHPSTPPIGPGADHPPSSEEAAGSASRPTSSPRRPASPPVGEIDATSPS